MRYFLVIFFIFSSAFAKECDDINLITAKNSPFDKIPVYDQNGSNTCYSFVTSSVVNYELLKNGEKELKVHPAWAALVSPDLSKIGALWSGKTKFSIQELLKKNNCPYEIVDKSLQEWAKKANLTSSQMLAVLDSATWKINDFSKSHTVEEVKASSLNDVLNQASQSIFKKTCDYKQAWPELEEHLNALGTFSSKEVLKEIIFSGCKDALKKVELGELKTNGLFREKENISVILSRVLKDKNPIAISFCADSLYNHSHEGLKMKEDKSGRELDKCSGHASMIVGQKKIGEQCHFLLRNTWGTGFSKWSKQGKCLCRNNTTGEILDDCTAKDHNNGQFSVEACWLPSSTIENNTYELTYFK